MKNRKWIMSSGLAFEDKEDMEILHKYALEGWIFREYRWGFYILHKENPQNLIFSYDIKKLQKDEKEEYIDIFRSYGWEPIKSSEKNIHFFAGEDGIIPIHTDEQIEATQFKCGFYWGMAMFMLGVICMLCMLLLDIEIEDGMDHRIYNILGAIAGALIGGGGMSMLGCGLRLIKKRLVIQLNFIRSAILLGIGMGCVMLSFIVSMFFVTPKMAVYILRMCASMCIPVGIIGILWRYPYFRDKKE